ncbi:beta-eliminating lyase-related protein [Ornithinibacter aureus]|uniref:Beta-eliminating lyase-related protein n=1 Tax=Ornithinibacter aureus TaxID=622664 RepID=A0ABP8K8A2_9MICO|nr:beta-eliminating lyase-related protein [Ornithinibacter aureus]KAF0833660.1 L-threonine aldolase [Ornithinibacter aureus]
MATDPAQPLSPSDRARAAEAGVTRWLTGRMPPTPADELRDLADVVADLGADPGARTGARAEAGADVAAGMGADAGAWDRYGDHGQVAALEARLADLLGKPAVAAFPSGVMAQQSMLRVWCDARGSRRVAIPALSHLLSSEDDGPRLLHGFRFEHLTHGPSVPGVDDLAAIPGPLGAALLELPLRDAGFLLPSWDDLVAFSQACRERGVPLHLDGARIWESAPALGHSPAQIADLADSVYVSFYKGLGGLAGAALAGPVDQIAEARRWRTRMGGTLFTLMPYAVAALRGLDRELPRMAEYHERAVTIAAGLQANGIRVSPSPPHTTAFRIHVERDVDDVNERRVTTMEREQVALTPRWAASEVPGWSWTEFGVGPATMTWEVEEIVDTLVRVFGR